MFLKYRLVSARISFNPIFLLLQLRYQHGLGTPDLRQTLPNLKNFMEHGLLVRWWVPLFLTLRNCNVHNHPEELLWLPHYSTPASLVFFCNKICEEKERHSHCTFVLSSSLAKGGEALSGREKVQRVLFEHWEVGWASNCWVHCWGRQPCGSQKVETSSL